MKTLEEGTLKPSVLRRWGSVSCHGFLVPLRAEGSGSVPSIKISSHHRKKVKANGYWEECLRKEGLHEWFG